MAARKRPAISHGSCGEAEAELHAHTPPFCTRPELLLGHPVVPPKATTNRLAAKTAPNRRKICGDYLLFSPQISNFAKKFRLCIRERIINHISGNIRSGRS